RPDAQPQVVQEHPGLGQGVLGRRHRLDLEPESAGRLGGAPEVPAGEPAPDEHEQEVEQPPPADHLPDRTGQEDAVEEQHGPWSGWSIHRSATANARYSARPANRPPNRRDSRARRTTP